MRGRRRPRGRVPADRRARLAEPLRRRRRDHLRQRPELPLWPPVTGRDPGAWTVRAALSSPMTNPTADFRLVLTATAVSLPPLVRVFLFLRRRPAQGGARTGIKG
ncbi:hypothetical protein GCM10019016_138460 [Streptomyces prasinosporus]|uniref:Uncharacterized protein n=1 Tax=Streptomyces prasinosporus TaxID=68256 RepID=A0ABP6UJY1_9ACTN